MGIISATPRLDIVLLIIEENPEIVERFIARKIFPVYETAVSTGPVPKLLARRVIERIKRARYGGFPRGTSEITDGAVFNCIEEGFEEPYDAKDIEALGGMDRVQMLYGARALQTVALVIEKTLADVLFSTSTFGAGYQTAAAAAWDNASGTPLDDVAEAMDQVSQRIGQQANTLVIGGGAHLALRKNAQIQSQGRAILGQTSREGIRHNISAETLAEMFGIEQVLVGDAMYNSADEGQAEQLTRVWSDDFALVCYVPPKNDLVSTGLGRTMVWSEGLEGVNEDDRIAMRSAGIEGMSLGEYGEPGKNFALMQAKTFEDQLLLNKDAGQLITGI